MRTFIQLDNSSEIGEVKFSPTFSTFSPDTFCGKYPVKVDNSLRLATNLIRNDLVKFAINLWCSIRRTLSPLPLSTFSLHIQTSFVLKIKGKVLWGLFFSSTTAVKRWRKTFCYFLNFLPRHVFAENGYVKVDYNSLCLATNLIGKDLIRFAINLWCSSQGHILASLSPPVTSFLSFENREKV